MLRVLMLSMAPHLISSRRYDLRSSSLGMDVNGCYSTMIGREGRHNHRDPRLQPPAPFHVDTYYYSFSWSNVKLASFFPQLHFIARYSALDHC